jgi:hypothetical protein
MEDTNSTPTPSRTPIPVPNISYNTSNFAVLGSSVSKSANEGITNTGNVMKQMSETPTPNIFPTPKIIPPNLNIPFYPVTSAPIESFTRVNFGNSEQTSVGGYTEGFDQFVSKKDNVDTTNQFQINYYFQDSFFNIKNSNNNTQPKTFSSENKIGSLTWNDQNTVNSTTYSFNTIYLYSNTHNISGISDSSTVGEIVIESDDKKGYLCFLLKTGSSSSTIDNFLKSTSDTTTMNLNKVIPNQDLCIYYKDSNSNKNIFIMLNPIIISKDTEAIIKTLSPIDQSPFSPNAPATNPSWYQIVDIHNVPNNNEIYIDCQPTGVSDEEIQMRNIPLNDNSSTGFTQLQAAQTVSNFAIFALILVFSWFSIPEYYKYLVVDSINLSMGDVNGVDEKKRIDFLATAILNVCFFIIFGMIHFSKLNSTNLVIGTGFLLFAVLFVIILFNNTFLNPSFLKTVSDEDAVRIIEATPSQVLNIKTWLFTSTFVISIADKFKNMLYTWDGKYSVLKLVPVVLFMILLITLISLTAVNTIDTVYFFIYLFAFSYVLVLMNAFIYRISF